MSETWQFSDFFKAVHKGCGPFLWQDRLAKQVVEEGWPSSLDVPTGAGKTAAIDIALFHLASEARANIRGGAPRRAAPRRVFFIVDRRLVVDDAHERALVISKALTSATSGILKEMADAIRAFHGIDLDGTDIGGGERVLRVARLRGGAPRDPDWLRTPSQPGVIVSTVDQIGSRLLFRGYGVSDTMKSVHAGLVGADALYLIDEAHLSTPFVETVKALFGAVSDGADNSHVFQNPALVSPFRVVTLSATPGKACKDTSPPFSLTDEDWEDPNLRTRLRASKPAQLIACDFESTATAFADAFAQRAWENSVLGGGAADVTCVVVNRVRRARQVFQNLQRRVATAGLPDDLEFPRVALLTGRTRPLARDRLLRGLVARMRAPKPGERRAPLLVVATQCVEAGADLDFDALVTEIAPLDCLRQRFGRLNRTGRDIPTQATIYAANDQIGARAKPDPVYGQAMARTSKLLQDKGKTKAGAVVVDFGLTAARSWLPPPAERAEYLAPVRKGLVVMPTFVKQWSQTSPIPADDPEVALFLHGPEAAPPDVQIVWRADIEYDSNADDKKLEQRWKSRVAACPPSSLEMLSVPYWEAVRWLGGEARADVADVEGSANDEIGSDFVRDRALRWCGSEDPRTRLLRPGRSGNSSDRDAASARRARLRPGDTIVVPASRGGCDAWGWNPMADNAVEDLGAEANERHRGRSILRLSTALLRLALEGGETARQRLTALNDFVARSSDWTDSEVRRRISEIPSALDPSWFDGMPDGLRRIEVIRASVDSSDSTVLALAYSRAHAPQRHARATGDGASHGFEAAGQDDSDIEAAGQAVTEDDQSVRGGQKSIDLSKHSKGVREFARAFARKVGVDRELEDDVALAAFLHDAGKAHPNFKLWLYGGDPFRADSPPLAKSGQRRLSPKARKVANLPQGARHEVASLLFARRHPALLQAHDPDLVMWLIGTHHGYGRPFFTEAMWPREGDTFGVDLGDGQFESEAAPAFAELQSAWFELRVRVHVKYGPWGLARLEAILRLADHRRSECEQDSEFQEEKA